MKDFYVGKDMRTKISKHLSLCLHCEKPVQLSRFQYGTILHGDKPGAVLHADYLYLASGLYLLVIVDDLSQKLDCFVTNSADAQTCAEAFLLWRSRYGLPSDVVIVSDNGSHFANQLIKQMESSLKLQHRFSVKYSPWSNGSAEVQNRKLLRLFRSLSSEYKSVEYERLLPLVLSFINNSRGRHSYSPNQIYCGVDKKPNTLFLGIPVDNVVVTPRSATSVKKFLNEIQKEMLEIYKMKFLLSEKDRAKSKKTSKHFMYQPGDWCLLSRSGTPQQRAKMKLTWSGPVQVMEAVSDHIYLVLCPDGKRKEVHTCRLRLYCEKAQLAKLDKLHIEQYQFDTSSFEVDNIVDLRFLNGHFEVSINWRGFEGSDNTWENASDIYKDIPDFLIAYLQSLDTPLASRCLASL
jgi:hypothetical protein